MMALELEVVEEEELELGVVEELALGQHLVVMSKVGDCGELELVVGS